MDTLTVAEIARRAKFGDPRTARRLLVAGGVPILRVGRRWAIEAGAVGAGRSALRDGRSDEP